MDLSMSRVDAIRAIRGREEFSRLLRIADTAFDRAGARDGAQTAGCDHYPSKLIDFRRLGVLVKKMTRPGRPLST
jgi:hypothetical protein